MNLIRTYHSTARELNGMALNKVMSYYLILPKLIVRTLQCCEITGPILHWVTAFLECRTQRVILDGFSDFA